MPLSETAILIPPSFHHSPPSLKPRFPTVRRLKLLIISHIVFDQGLLSFFSQAKTTLLTSHLLI